MQDLQTFNFEELPVRTLTVDEEPYFVGKDVAEILGYARTDNAIRNHVDNEDKLTHQLSASGQNRNMVIINESGLYSLIFDAAKQSKNKNIRKIAKNFKRWVTSDVLPSIRKHGIYATDNVIEQTLQNPDYIINILTEYKKEREGRLLAEQQVQELKPKATYYDLVLQNKSLLSVTKIAKDYGMSARTLNKLLHELGVQYKQGDIWLLYAKYQDKGYTQTSTYALDDEHSKVSTKWTQKGRLFIYDLLKRNNILPMIEKQSI
ncbi:prophage antirepressor [Staphylococcus microti]|uniref:Prophage antirepressor n=1 Tax=Staphylococcus microti TaxID=569857 RepID=A0A0D6XSP6_9STAP|nr:phage antirepressor KilAC domain-containing protein [Staphylococcus microti]KIX91440.1 prophage antirepressor [Staphylococcus microti]PNZ82495.1 phage antirepressor [Staphylococcus microti]PNZ83680.1 phage antirepressor [Staphylococcus microti]SUM57014.1 putative antirepressor, phage associated [Staphylococcus microti]